MDSLAATNSYVKTFPPSLLSGPPEGDGGQPGSGGGEAHGRPGEHLFRTSIIQKMGYFFKKNRLCVKEARSVVSPHFVIELDVGGDGISSAGGGGGPEVVETVRFA